MACLYRTTQGSLEPGDSPESISCPYKISPAGFMVLKKPFTVLHILLNREIAWGKETVLR
jgi:hypothetical protein